MVEPGKTSEKPEYPTSFGLFYPVGYLVVGFKNKESALQVQQDLKTGGYEDNDCTFFSCKEVTEAATENLEKSSAGFLPRLGWDDEAIKVHLETAKEGGSFLVIYAPDNVSSDRAMNVIRRAPFEFVHRYHRLAIEELE
jgi:hypothetical protein